MSEDRYIWHSCYYDGLKCQYPEDDKPPLDNWVEWLDKYGNIELARMKEDACDHFFPPQKIIKKEEDIIAWRYSKEIDEKK